MASVIRVFLEPVVVSASAVAAPVCVLALLGVSHATVGFALAAGMLIGAVAALLVFAPVAFVVALVTRRWALRAALSGGIVAVLLGWVVWRAIEPLNSGGAVLILSFVTTAVGGQVTFVWSWRRISDKQVLAGAA